MIELLTPAEMAEADRLTIAGGLPGFTLMQAAGKAVADCVSGLAAAGARLKVVAGPGNNGGDGYIAASLLAARGYGVEVLRFGEPPDHGDSSMATALWRGLTAAAEPALVADADLVVDALFGAGLTRPIQGEVLELIEAINACGRPVVAVDLPSGIVGATGEVMGAAVQADATVTFFRRKPGHLLFPGRRHCGEVHVAQIGIQSGVLETIRPRAFANAPSLWRGCYPIPARQGHKYSRGHALVVSGGIASTGAARLAARGALRAGAGLVTIATSSEALPVVAADSLAVMVRCADNAVDLAAVLEDHRLNAVVLGPGGGVGEAMRQAVYTVLNGERGVVLDADALTSFAGRLNEFKDLIASQKARCIVTPHEGEFARLFKDCPEVDDSSCKLDRARAAAAHLGATIILKGPDTVVAVPDGRAAIADNAPPWLATAGSGDVLAGMAGGLLAQGMPAFEAAAAAVWLHAEAGAAFGPGLIAEDIPEALPGVLRKLI